MKLCLYKVTKSDARIRPLFANSVTYEDPPDPFSAVTK